MSVRATPHLPCRFDCPDTVRLGAALLELGRSLGFDREIDDLLTVLSWPVEWSALHGICEIRTPIFKVVTCTDATATTYRVRLPGSAYPDEGAAGLAFPYRPPVRQRASLSRSFRSGLAHAEASEKSIDGSRQNGFASPHAMNVAHAPLVTAAAGLLDHHGGAVLDLGCGNGALLKKINALRPNAIPYGIDRNKAAIAVARSAMPEFAANFWVGDIWQEAALWTRRFRLVLLSLRRFEEIDDATAAALIEKLGRQAEQVLVYAYAEQGRSALNTQVAAQFGLALAPPSGSEPSVSWARLRFDQ
jgi:hypothetical protein